MTLAYDPVLQTGQTLSYDADGNVVSDGSIKDDGYYQTGADRNYSRSVAGVVTDSNTKLQWQDDYSDNGDVIKWVGWQGAIDYCSTLGLDGGEWRLPISKELVTLSDYGRAKPAIDPKFTQVHSDYYWSSTTYAGYTSNAWGVYFYSGVQDHQNKSDNYNVRCVRSGQINPSDLSRSGDIVSDDSTQLQWQDDAVVSVTQRTWQEAIDYCENTLSLGGHEDWRLPNFNELISIVDDTQSSPAIESSSNGFKNTASYYYWSSTTYAGYTSNAGGRQL